MFTREPNLLTLLDWSQQAARGEPCAAWLAWRRSSPLAARRAAALVEVADRLDCGEGPIEAGELGATDVAEYVEGRVSPLAAEQIEAACWNSPEQLYEMASAVRFAQDSADCEEFSSGLTERLLVVAPRAIERRKRRAMNTLATQVPVAVSAAHIAPAAVPRASVNQRRTAMPSHSSHGLHWSLVAAMAALLVVTTGAVIGWWISATVKSSGGPAPVARDLLPAPTGDDDGEQPLVNRIVTPAPASPEPGGAPAAAEQPQSQPKLVRDQPPPARQHAVPAPAAVLPAVAKIESAIGAVLVDPGQRGRLRVGQGSYSLAEPLRLVSLAESWSNIEIPEVGTLVLSGPAQATLASWGDGVLEVELDYGKLGIERLPAGRQVRFQTGAAQWLARGTSNYSSLAVIHDPQSPSLFVPAGSVAVENIEVAADEVVHFVGGAVEPPQPLAAGRPAADRDALAGSWLTPPDDERKKKWHGQYGKIIDKLAIVDDAVAELPLLFASTRDTRQAALLAEWNLAIVDEATRPEQLWTHLGDHRQLVRIAAVHSLFAIRAGDPRLAHFVRYVRVQQGDDTGTRMAQWMRGKDLPGQIAVPQAVELAEFLSHRDLAMRQLAVSLLERHATPALARTRRAPPAYDAADPPGKRVEAQRQWRQLIRQIFTAQRTAPAALAPQLAPNPANAKQP